ncbi:hypothetical protein RERY_24150 [Rhodococcus erythropolis]|nr:hypothetical protein RERY_24150 [Rhodococcus erythropolis]
MPPAPLVSRSTAARPETIWERTRIGSAGLRSWSASAAWMPSSACVGGMRTSTIEMSGAWARTASGRASPLSTAATTSCPAVCSRLRSPSQIRRCSRRSRCARDLQSDAGRAAGRAAELDVFVERLDGAKQPGARGVSAADAVVLDHDDDAVVFGAMAE